MLIRLASVAAAALGIASASTVPVDLSTWVEESVGSANWVLAGDNNSVTQTLNGAPTVYYDPSPSQGKTLAGTIRVNTGGDDDFIGFVLGFESGDLSTDNPGFLLLDWKQNDQSGTPRGLALSRVTGNIDTDPPFGSIDRAQSLTELARGTTLGNVGWADLQTYSFELVFTPTLVKVFVDGVEEISVTGSFENGGFGFYNYSQGNVTYGAIEEGVAPPIPVPGAAALFLPAALGAVWRRRKAA